MVTVTKRVIGNQGNQGRSRDAEGLEPLLPVSSAVGFQPLSAPLSHVRPKSEAQQRHPKRYLYLIAELQKHLKN